MHICKFCQKTLKNANARAQHENKCSLNENRLLPFSQMHEEQRSGKRRGWNFGLTKDTNSSLQIVSDKLKEKYQKNPELIKGCFAWSTEERRNATIKQGWGGYREGSGSSKKFFVNDSFGIKTCLQSSYEYRFFLMLLDRGINWYRPKYLSYDEKKYFPDFYLCDYDMYIDTKNDYLIVKDKSKIEKVIEENNVKLYVISNQVLTTLENMPGYQTSEWLRPITEC